MQLVNLNLDYYNFFCPVTGKRIIGKEYECDDSVESLMGYWYDEYLDEPTIKNEVLEKA